MRYFLTFYGMGDELLGIVEIIKKVSYINDFIVDDDYIEDDYEGTISIDIDDKDIKLIWTKKKSKELKDIVLSGVLPVNEIGEILDSRELIKEILNRM